MYNNTMLPNLISFCRLLSTPFIVYFIMGGMDLWAFGLFIVASLSDAVDGAIARNYNAQSSLGMVLDPIADKVLILSTVIALGVYGPIPWALVFCIIFRDAAIVLGGVSLLRYGPPSHVQAQLLGKLHSFTVFLLICMVLLPEGRFTTFVVSPFYQSVVIPFMIGVAYFMTFASGASYGVRWYRLRSRSQDDSNEG